jgi:hypothetical protein
VIHIENLLHALQLFFISIFILPTDFRSYVLGLRFSRPKFSALLRLSGLLHAECLNVSANVVAIFTVMSLRRAGIYCIDLAVADDGSARKP